MFPYKHLQYILLDCTVFHVYVCEMYLSVFRNEVWERDAALGKFAVHCSHSKMNSYNHKNI